MRRGGMGSAAVVLVLAGCLGASTAWGQLAGQISTAKDVYVAGEPIYVHFEVTNTGTDAVEYAAGDPYERCGGYWMEVSGGTGPEAERGSCGLALGADEECTVSNQLLAPGARLRQNLLVNYAHSVATPGNYEIHAMRVVKYGPLGDAAPGTPLAQEFKVEARLKIEVLKADPELLKRIYQSYVTNLKSPDDEIQREAERAIVSGAPAWLEETIVGMVRRYTSREFALRGLRNLNTERSREELAKILQNTAEATPVNVMAASYLGQMGDKKYFPLLMELAKRQDPKESRDYVVAAAELGGDEAVPFLKAMASSADANARANGVAGLGVTGSRAAVPVLVETLKGADAELGKLVVESLKELTHRTEGDGKSDPPAEQYGAWAKWWVGNGEGARIYGICESEDVKK